MSLTFGAGKMIDEAAELGVDLSDPRVRRVMQEVIEERKAAHQAGALDGCPPPVEMISGVVARVKDEDAHAVAVKMLAGTSRAERAKMLRCRLNNGAGVNVGDEQEEEEEEEGAVTIRLVELLKADLLAMQVSPPFSFITQTQSPISKSFTHHVQHRPREAPVGVIAKRGRVRTLRIVCSSLQLTVR